MSRFFDRGAITADDRLAEAALGLGLLRERPLDVVARRLAVAERQRVEHRVVGVQRGDRVDVRGRPGLGPGLGPRSRSAREVGYFATSTARDSRMTMTFT